MNRLPRPGRDLRKSSLVGLAASVVASAALVGCGPPDAGSIKAPGKDEMTKGMFPEPKSKTGKPVEGGSQATPLPKR